RKSYSSRSQVNDLNKTNYENEIRIHHHNHRVVADRSIRTNTACAATAAASAPPPALTRSARASRARSAGSSRKRAEGSHHLSRCGHFAGANGGERSAWPGE